MEEKKQRDYKKEREKEREIVKKYTVRISKKQAEIFEEKAKESNEKPTTLLTKFCIEGIEKYFKKR